MGCDDNAEVHNCVKLLHKKFVSHQIQMVYYFKLSYYGKIFQEKSYYAKNSDRGVLYCIKWGPICPYN